MGGGDGKKESGATGGGSERDSLSLSLISQYNEIPLERGREIDLSFLVRIKAVAEMNEDRRAPVTLIATIDRSASMKDKLPLVKDSLKFMVQQLRDEDKLAIVTFDHEVDKLLPITSMTSSGKVLAKKAIESIRERGHTNLSGGLLAALQLLYDVPLSESTLVESIVLFTDGKANFGIKDREPLAKATKSMVNEIGRQVCVFTLGYGSDHDSDTLHAISDAGNGLFYFVENKDSIPDSFCDCLGGLLSIAAQNLVLTLTVNDELCRMVKPPLTSYVTESCPKQTYKITIPDIYCEEEKCIPIHTRLLAASSTAGCIESKAQILSCSLTYFDILRCSPKTTTATGAVLVSKEISDPVIVKEYQEDIELHLTRYDVAEAISSATKLADEGQLESARAALHRYKACIKKSVVFGLPLAKYFEETIDESLKGLASQSHYSGHGKPSMMNYSLSHYQQQSHGAGAGASSILSDGSGVIDRDTVVESFFGEKFYLIEFIAFILQHLKNLLMDHFSRTTWPLKTTDFDWVITVPAIWDAPGKRMMREAAYLAGLLTEYGSINKFTPVSYRSLPLPNEVNPDKLSLALEPESAALYSQETVGDQIESDPATSIIPRPSDYMVIDAGGGTIDITAHIEADGSIVVENIPTGNAWGGTQINEAFSKILEGIANDPGFEKFLASGDRSQNMADIIKIFYTEFESEKLLFGKEQTEEIRISLPSRFVRFHDKNLQAGIKKRSGIDYEDDMLYISKEVVESELFGPALNGIIECTLQAIKSNDNDLSTFYLVGGFGGCKYVHKKVKAAIDKSFHGQGRSCNVIVPPTPQLAVATGAAIWRKNPEKIKARRSDATYGIGATQSFEDDKHDEYYKFYNEEQEKYKCDSIFSVFLEKGELAKSDEVITASSRPSRQRNTTMKLQIYSTPDLGIQYIKDKNGKSTVTKIGQIVIDIPNPDNLPREKRLVDVTMDFSGTEIQAKAKYRVTGEEVKTVCDFLSAQQT
uniref:VWFA domain-containing protein n=1 Tax=Amphimedon queenslandica TaxID=400682 RepID=A0A1X7TRL4_AMPQE